LNIINPSKQIEIEKLYKSGMSIRFVSKQVGVSKQTVNSYFKLLRMKLGTVLCPCGAVAGHRGWCSLRFAASPARQLWIRGTWIAKPRNSCETIGVTWRPDFNVVAVNHCRVKACPFPRMSGSSVCSHHFNEYSLSFSNTDQSIDWRDLYSPKDTSGFPLLSVTRFDEDNFLVERHGSRTREVLQKEASANFQHLGAQILCKGFGKRKIRKAQRHRASGWHGKRPEHDVFKRWNRDSMKEEISDEDIRRHNELVDLIEQQIADSGGLL
jgi:hypothetical protein